MENERILQLENEVRELRGLINQFMYPDKYVFERPITGTLRGTKIEKTGGKIGFLGVEPVVQYTTALNSPAGATYGGNEQNMLNAFRLGLVGYGLFHT